MLENATLFSDQWVWFIFVGAGLLMILLELAVGIATGLDLVFIGSAFILGGLVTWPFHSWVLTLVVTCVICIAYVFIGRRYVHRWATIKKYQTNVDAIIGKTGVVVKAIGKNNDGLVKVVNEEWKARAADSFSQGDEVVVKEIHGVTLVVEKAKGGNS